MISLKRLEAMRRWQRDGGQDMAERDTGPVAWAGVAGLLRINYSGHWKTLVPTEALAPAIAKAEAEHARHRTLEQREVNRKRDGDANRAKQAADPGLWRWRTWP